MKTTHSKLMMVALVALLGLTLTACDDAEVAYSLEGTWEGNTEMAATYNGYTYESTYSYVCFNRDPYSFTSGTGYWVDYYRSDAPWEYIANHIEWEVTNGEIYVYFVEDNYEVWIEDYRLTDGRFVGRFYVDGVEPWDFSLVHTSSPNWSDYNYGYGYYYAPAKDGAKAATQRPQRTVISKK